VRTEEETGFREKIELLCVLIYIVEVIDILWMIKMAEMFALPTIIEKEIRALIKSGYYASIDEAVKDAFRTLLNAKPDLRTFAAIELYKEGAVSLGKAAEIVGVTTIEFKEILADRGIRREVGSMSVEELEKGVELIKRLRG